MNPIFQDRDINVRVLHPASMASHGHVPALTRRALAMLSNRPQSLAGLGIDTQEQVGKNRGGSWQSFANWIQLADGCQLNSFTDQRVSDFEVQLAVGSRQKLPTELSHCFHSLSTTSEVGENCPLPTGEVDTPDWESGCLPRSRTCCLDCGREAQAEVTL